MFSFKPIFSKLSDNETLVVMTDRNGGVSRGKFSSLNLGINTDDDIMDVEQNYFILKANLQIDRLVNLNQVHGNIIHEVTSSNYNDIAKQNGDGLFTVDNGLALAILTADCFPVVLIGDIGVAVLHCGWRSLNTMIIENAINFFNNHGDKVRSAFVGAGISEDVYYVKNDMVVQIDNRYNPESCLHEIQTGEYKLNLKKLLLNALKLNNINIIDILDATTQEDRFFSYRRDNGTTGRMATVVMKR